MKKINKIIIFIFLSFLFFLSFSVQASSENSVTIDGITIEGVTENELFKKPKIMFYVSDKNTYYNYEILLDTYETETLILKNEQLDLEEEYIVKDGSYYIGNTNLNIDSEYIIQSIKLEDTTYTKIASATLNGNTFSTNTNLGTTFENGDYTLIVTDTDGRIATVNFTLGNDTYFVEVCKQLLTGVKVTIKLFLITLVLSIPLGLIGAALKRIKIVPLKFLNKYNNKFLTFIAKFNPLRLLLDIYTWVIRGTPLLLQLFIFNFGPPILFGSSYNLGPMNAAILTFVINYTAYFVEIFRGGMESINKGQFEACKVMGLNPWQTNFRIILPQTFKKVIPSITNESINLVKDTALVSSLAIADLLYNTNMRVTLDFRMDAYFVAAAIYLILTLMVVIVFRQIEKKYSYYN